MEATTSAASHEVRLHIGVGDTAPPDNIVKAPGGDLPRKGPYRLRRVPQWVRAANRDAYAPKFMCFGPYHYYSNHVGLHDEELKGRYVTQLLQDADEHHDEVRRRQLRRICEPRLREMSTDTREFDVGLRHKELKERYATELLQDAEPDDEARRHQLRQICEQRLREMTTDICEFYAYLGPIAAAEMTTEAWVKMMFLDGCFILKHLYNYGAGVDEDELHQTRWAPTQLRSDLTLLENQIPFTVLLALFHHLAPQTLALHGASKKKKRRKLLDMALWYMLKGSSLPPNKRPTDELGVDTGRPIDHLLHLLHVAHCAQLDAAQKRRRPPERDLLGFVSSGLPIRLMKVLRCLCMFSYERGLGHVKIHGNTKENVPSASALKAMGIRITRTTGPGPDHDGGLLDVRFMEDRVRLEILPLYVEQTTAPLLQNLIAFE